MKKTIKTLIILTLLFLNISIIKAANYIWPIDEENAYETKIEYGYGPRNYDWQSYDKLYNYEPRIEKYYGNQTENHYGVDIIGIKGHTYNVVSVVDGTVLTTSRDQVYKPGTNFPDRNQRHSSFDGGGYGNYIVIKEDSTGLCFLYGHLKAGTIALKNGDRVKKGQKIAVMGSSGDSGHMHLHFEVRPNQISTTYGINLVVTTQYGKETLNPIDYIGQAAPKKIEEKIEPIVEEPVIDEPIVEEPIINEPIVEEKKAEIKNITIENNSTYGKINIEFNKSVDFKVIPTLEVTIKNETKQANYISKTTGNIHTYVINYNNFDPTTFGNMYITLKNGQIISSDNKTNVNYEINNKYIGTLSQLLIPNTYEESYKNQKGDVNNDGIVDARDASIVLSIYAKISTDKPLSAKEKEQLTRADMNGDGYVNGIDSSAILSYYAKGSVDEGDINRKNIIKCDLNKDGKVTIMDYNLLTSNINSRQEKYDLNGDAIVNNNDIEFFKKILKENGQR